ncbi:16S rRNA (cytosine(1402)-N(4))-methyltransferase RsmH [Ruminococcus flavefaciens]|uniref:16S rRNA (cytosine(1402)-N(4))-methyltransferase RsmH n=1 Tax=Ruminococcus flavefaciens TaxID=1265 RepID=UPI0026EC9244|nr:16S rRNA (cytosine(1402)-N(4))-methyltransferase RsmH [Ruminococcus flavefaciens]MDD7517520.1 16S rRNA (cytosine(1402)-N(4))-methyltransferase RsmH [Ruminococcus flavefaciens]MDY5691491.1 16S rRNA (cytosine(1402)-N(4))-methyltransferase RsmH [Ruminococcus flavefaciens]
MEFSHIPVMLEECIEGLDIRPDGIYVDGTAGGAGHSSAIAARLNEKGRLIALDRDPDAVAVATERLSVYSNASVFHRNYSEIRAVLDELDIDYADGILMDLGVSSFQLDEGSRGFSYHSDAPLDMRMSKEGMSAADIVNTYSESELARIIFEYGEEKFSRRIASNIVKARETAPIETTLQLADIIRESVPQKARREKNPCKKTFQAIRIAVNGEFEHLEKGLEDAFYSLRAGGRLAVITFHSLEDRIVKKKFAEWCKGCICPPDFPQCVCGHKPQGKLVNRKPLEAKEKELERNNRSRSAKLRIIERSAESNG